VRYTTLFLSLCLKGDDVILVKLILFPAASPSSYVSSVLISSLLLPLFLSESVFHADVLLPDPPKPPSLRIEEVTAGSVTVSWRLDLPSSESPSSTSSKHSLSQSSASSQSESLSSQQSLASSAESDELLSGFILSYKRNEDAGIDEWEKVRLAKSARRHVLSNLLCGNKYVIRMIAFNEVGSSDASDEVHFSTSGRPPIAADKFAFVRSNMTSVTLNLSSWRDGGCPISHFVIQFKPKSQPEWILLSNHILPEQETISIRELTPGSWHDLLVLVKNEAGTTEANYVFATLTMSGATIAPMLLSDHVLMRSPLSAVMVLIPSFCAIAVLVLVGGVAVYVLLCRRRLDTDSHPDHCEYWQYSCCARIFLLLQHQKGKKVMEFMDRGIVKTKSFRGGEGAISHHGNRNTSSRNDTDREI
jgi:hypothetical protein